MYEVIGLIMVVSAVIILLCRWVTSTADTFIDEMSSSHIRAVAATFGVGQQGASESNSDYKERVLNKIRNPLGK